MDIFWLISLFVVRELRKAGVDACGLAQLASRTVGVPFVDLVAAAIAVSELLRRLHGADGLELACGSVAALGDLETVRVPSGPYAHGHVHVAGPENAAGPA